MATTTTTPRHWVRGGTHVQRQVGKQATLVLLSFLLGEKEGGCQAAAVGKDNEHREADSALVMSGRIVGHCVSRETYVL